MNLCSRYLYLILVVFSSCTSVQKLTYLQDQQADNTKENELIKSIQLKESQYHLRPSDRIQLTIFSLTEEKINFLKNPVVEAVVDSKGQIELPVIGSVNVNGLTIKQAEEKVKAVSSDYLKSPSISIKLLNFNYTVIGEVNRQGTFNATEPKVNILEAIGQAGGLTENANRENIRIIRNENNTAKIYKLNVLEDNSLQSANYYLQPSDVVVVNPVKVAGAKQERFATVGLIVSIVSSLTFLLIQAFN
jgi:polysaccharide export outer membrane protein